MLLQFYCILPPFYRRGSVTTRDYVHSTHFSRLYVPPLYVTQVG
jgi:hypothetical protein